MFNLISTFFEWSATDTTDMLGFTKSLIGDFTPFLLPILGVALALIVLVAIIRSLR